MNKITILIVVLLLCSNSLAQVQVISEKMQKNRLELEFESPQNFYIQSKGNQSGLVLNNQFDESKPGIFNTMYADIFIAIPANSKPDVQYNEVESIVLNALPTINPTVYNETGELKYSDYEGPVIKEREEIFTVKGYLWIENFYCLHLKVRTLTIDAEMRNTSFLKKFKVDVVFENNVEQMPQGSSVVINSLIANKQSAGLFQSEPKHSQILESSWINFNQTYVKIGVARDGIYRFKYVDLVNLGLPVSSINPKLFKLFVRGSEVPVFVFGEDDNSFDLQDYVEFAGQRNMGGKHRELNPFGEPYNEYLGRYSDTTIYWLTWGQSNGLRVVTSSGNPNIIADTLKYYPEVIHYERDVWFDFSMADLVRREMPFWYENKTWVDGQLGVGVRNYTFSVSNVFPNKPFQVFARLQNYASNVSQNAHLLAISVNTTELQDSGYIAKFQQKILKGTYSSNLLANGNNTLKIHSFPTTATLNSSAFDWYEVEYPRFLRTYSDSLLFNFPFLSNAALPYNMQITNVNTDNIVIWKYGSNYKRFILPRLNNAINLYDTLNSGDKYSLQREDRILTPKIYYAKQFVNLSNPQNKADYIAITHKAFLSKTIQYSSFIASNYGITTKVIDVDDIYDEFAHGFFIPEAIRDFLKITHTNWQAPKPKYVALIGGATYDYYGNKHKYFSNIPPVYNYVPSFGASVSDNWFVTWDTTGAYVPQMNVGRLPVKTNTELESYFNKHINHISSPFNEWNKNYLFFSGGTSNDQNQLNQLREVNNFVLNNYATPAPIGGNSNHFYKTMNPTTNFGPFTAAEVQRAIDVGAVFISYIGHSGTQTWDNSITQAVQLKNKVNRNPLISDFGCSTARFAESDVTSFSQLFVLSNDGQAIAYIGNSSLGFLSTSVLVPKLFYKKMLQDSVYNISEALKLAKLEMLQTYGSTGVYQLFALTNTLIGDPIVALPIPPKPNLFITGNRISFSNSSLTDDLDSIKILFSYLNIGKVLADSFNIKVFNNYADTLRIIMNKRLLLPKFSDTVEVYFKMKNKPGIHQLRIALDTENEIDEITKTDNEVNFSLTVASTSLRTTLLNEVENGLVDTIYYINPVGKPVSDSISVEISSNSNFSFPETKIVPVDTFFTKINLSNLINNKRYWLKTKITNTEYFGKVTSFVFGNSAKYLLKDSLSFNKAQKTNIKFRDSRLVLDSASYKLSAISAGFWVGSTALISLNSTNFIPENTLRGHHICLFQDSTYEFKGYRLFDLHGGGTTATNNYINFLDTLSSDLIVVIAVSNEGRVTSVPLRNRIKTLGSKYIDSLGEGGSWAIIGKKGAPQGTVPEAFALPATVRVEVDTTIYKRYNNGTMLTSQLGPVSKWENLKVEQAVGTNYSINYRPIGIKEDGTTDTLGYLSFNNNLSDLSNINAKVYPYLKVLAVFNAASNAVSPSLSSLGVSYVQLPELGVNYQTVSVSKDSVFKGDSLVIKSKIYNAGESTAENVKVVFELIKPDNSKRVLLEKVFPIILPFEKKSIDYVYRSSNWDGIGNFAVNVIVDSGNYVKELFEDNNLYRVFFKVKEDTVTSIKETSFTFTVNDKEVFDGDYLPSRPKMKIVMQYPTWFDLDDSTAVQFNLSGMQINRAKFDEVKFDTINRTITFNYSPVLADGEYQFRIFAKDVNGSISEVPSFEKYFVVVNQLKILHVYNYPNPFSTNTNFTFKLTQIPDELIIKVYTIAGRLIKELKKTSNELSSDFNYIPWDGRDEDGDVIANGVYLYKVIAKHGGKSENITQKLAIVR